MDIFLRFSKLYNVVWHIVKQGKTVRQQSYAIYPIKNHKLAAESLASRGSAFEEAEISLIQSPGYNRKSKLKESK